MTKTAVATAFLWTLAPLLAQVATESPAARQVYWQRSLDDALALCKATSRPLLIAVNMDGESASDRIVHEEYVDPAFVALTRHCVCLGASVFRHNARDHDDDGRRIPCPRFGGITCGEHMALEPQLWEKYLSDGDRVAPRHALVLASGKKAFDLSLCFDLKDIDRALEAAIAEVPPLDLSVPVDADWATLAARRDCCGRAALEAAIGNVRAHDSDSTCAAIMALGEHGDAGSLEALRLVAARLPLASTTVEAVLRGTAERLGGPTGVAALWRGFAQDIGAMPGDPEPDARTLAADTLLPEGPLPPAAVSFALACAAVGTGHALALAGRGADAPGNALVAKLADRLPVRLSTLLQSAAVTPRRELTAPPPGASDAMPEAAELERQLEALDQTPKDQRQDPEWCARFAKASLDLGRRRIESGGRDAGLLLDDAEQSFARALSKRSENYGWWIERARASYFRQKFDQELECGQRALAIASGEASIPNEAVLAATTSALDARTVEALRWIGDACAHLLGERTGKDAAVELGGLIDGLRALGIAAASPFGTDQDWLSFGSFCTAIGLPRQAAAIAQAGAMLFPTSRELRQQLNVALWSCGRPELSPAVAAAIARAHPSADASWHSGYACLVAAEDARRRELPEAAWAHYREAGRGLNEAATLNPGYADSCNKLRALAVMGMGMAHAQAGDQAAAADALRYAVTWQRDLAQVKDGMGCDVFDLVDRALEWRATGPSPVDPMQMLAAIDKNAPDTPFYAAAISDALLREALRADGRNPVRKPRRTVDAGGNPITMPMGLPNAEGDRYLLASIEVGRVAAARAQAREDKVPLAQSLTIWAERGFERGDNKGVREALAEAAPLLGLPPPAADAGDDALRACAAQLRSQLGEARPRWRDGR